jgi:LysR family glycine cleavage system transcriptional activator
MDIGYFAARH